MKIAITCLLLLSVACQLAICRNGVVSDEPTTKQQYQCYFQNGFGFAAIRAYTEEGSPDTNAAKNVLSAYSANIASVDLLMYPCPKSCSKSATKQVEELYTYLNENQVIFNRMWLVVENWDNSNTWFFNETKNRAFFDELTKASVNKGWYTGVFSAVNQWNDIMGKDFQHGYKFPVWYRGNTEANFQDWRSFGGWNYPTMKDIVPSWNNKCDSRLTRFAYNPNY